MTSIRHYPDPHIVKLNGRYKFYPKFKYRIDFDTYGEKWQRWVNVINWCEATWGKEWKFSATAHVRNNPNYRSELVKNKRYRRLYLSSEQDLTMMLLVISA